MDKSETQKAINELNEAITKAEKAREILIESDKNDIVIDYPYLIQLKENKSYYYYVLNGKIESGIYVNGEKEEWEK